MNNDVFLLLPVLRIRTYIGLCMYFVKGGKRNSFNLIYLDRINIYMCILTRRVLNRLQIECQMAREGSRTVRAHKEWNIIIIGKTQNEFLMESKQLFLV